MPIASHPTKTRVVLLLGGLWLFVMATLAYGTWHGFPVQDDTYMIRLLRLGGPERIVAEHPDRPVYGFLLAAGTRLGGEHKAVYIALGLLGWTLFAAQASRLWTRLFPEWFRAWPLVGLAVVAPVVQRVQFSTLTTLIPCVLPVMLVVAGLLPLLRSDDRAGRRLLLLAFFLATAAALVSEYGLAAAAGAAALLLLLGRWRSAIPIALGAPLGYAIFHATAQLSLRKETNPALQAGQFLSRPWTRPFRVASATWNCVVGAWGRSASEITIDWNSKTTLLAALAGVAAAAVVAAIWVRPAEAAPVARPARRLIALIGAVFAGIYPAIAIMGWPPWLTFQTRFLLPAVPFAACATVGLIIVAVRPKWVRAALCITAFVAGNAFVLKSVEERRRQKDLDAVGSRLRPFVGDETGLVVLVSSDGSDQSDKEVMAKVTYRWGAEQGERLVLLRPADALRWLGPRTGCRSPDSVRLKEPAIRWPRAEEPVRLMLWDAGDFTDLDPEPYYRGCRAP